MSAPLRVLTWMPPEMTARVTREVEGVELIHTPARGPFPEDAAGEVLLVGARSVPIMEEALRSGVRWIHIYGTGVDDFPIELLDDGQTLTCSRGASGVPIAEWVMATMLAFEKRLMETSIHEPWDRRSDPGLGTLSGKTLGLVGWAASALPSPSGRCPSACGCSPCGAARGRARCRASSWRATSASCSGRQTTWCSPPRRPPPPTI